MTSHRYMSNLLCLNMITYSFVSTGWKIIKFDVFDISGHTTSFIDVFLNKQNIYN